MLKAENPDAVVTARKHSLYTSRWNPMLAEFVGWECREEKFKGAQHAVMTWFNARNERKSLSFDRTYAQGMWALQKVEEFLTCKSFVGTDSCFIYPLGENSKLPNPVEFKGAARMECIYNCVVEAILLSNSKN